MGKGRERIAHSSLQYTLLHMLFIALFCLFCLIYPIAVTGVAFDVQPPFSLRWAGSALLLLEGVLLLLAALFLYGIRAALNSGIAVIGLSYLVEFIGVNTGTPFGIYHYTDILFLHLPGGVPLAVMFAWVLIVFGAYSWVRPEVRRLNIGDVLLGATLATLLDLAIEPVAAHVVHYWEWSTPGSISYYGVPFANFSAWFLVTSGLLLLVGRCLAKKIAPTQEKGICLALLAPRLLFAASLFMFGLVDLTHGYYVATLLAVLAGGVLFWRQGWINRAR